jgi:Zn-dependent protease with chaperone function
MTGPASFPARYFDGRSGHAQQAQVAVEADGLAIEAERESVFWRYRDLTFGPKHAAEIRLGNRRAPDAALVVPVEASPSLHAAAPEIFSGARERRRMTALIVTLILGAGAVGGAVFFGAPAASGPLAQATPKDLEIQIGENLAAQINAFLKPCGAEGVDLVTPVINDLAERGEAGFPIRFQFIRASAPNAFALPGGQVMATSGLMNAIGDDQEAFLAVIAHELGHVRARDGMRAVYRNAGLGVALEIVTGGSGAAQQAVLVGGQLSQLRHNRIQEAAADETAAEIMARADLDPAALARAFEAITHYDYDPSEDDGERSLPTWLRTHPDTQARIKAALARKGASGPLPLSESEWRAAANACDVEKRAE